MTIEGPLSPTPPEESSKSGKSRPIEPDINSLRRHILGKDYTEKSSIEAEPRPGLVAKYSLFREKFQPKADVIYHPCGANDVSPSAAFPESRVIYVDIDDESVDALKKGGFEAHTASALEFDPGKVDILIMLNPQISPDVPSSYVIKNGFVLSNNYHDTANSLYQNKQYQFRGLIRKTSKEEGLILDTENLEDCWEEVETEEEFKNAPFSFGVINYNMAAQVVEVVTGKKENVLAEYKKIIADARKKEQQENARILKEHPELANTLNDPDKTDVFLLNHRGKTFALSTRLPRKKGVVDDIFIFQKIKPDVEISETSDPTQ